MRVRALIPVLVVCVAIPAVASAQTGGKFTALTQAKPVNGNITINFANFKNPEEAISAYQFSVMTTVSTGGGGAGAGKATFNDVTFIKPVTPMSQELFLACATGKHIPQVTIEVSSVNAKGQKTQFLEIKLMDVIVSSYSSSGGGDVPVDSVSLNFASMTYTVF